MTVRNAIDRLRSDIKELTGDTHLSNRHLYSILKSSRDVLLERNKDRIYRTGLPKREIDTERVLLSEVSCVSLDCYVCRAKVGNVSNTKDGPLLVGIGSPDFSETFNLVTADRYEDKVSMDPEGNYAFLDGEYLYLSKCIPCIKVGVVNNIQGNESCGILDTDVGIPDYLVDALFKMSLESLRWHLSKPLDITQNANPNG